MKIISLFSGAGGLDLGLIQAGNEVIWANDIDANAVETYRHNIGNHMQYPALVCTGHLKDKNSCSQKFIREDALQASLTTMMNKLIFARKEILHPLESALHRVDQKEAAARLAELEEQLDKNARRQATLTAIMTKGYLDPALFTKESNVLIREAQDLTDEKNNILYTVKGDRNQTEELTKLIQFCNHAEIMESFDGDCFADFVKKVVIHDRNTAEFELKCGLTLKERIQ